MLYSSINSIRASGLQAMEPTVIEYQELKQITDGFSENRKIGEGGYGKVYWVRLQTCLLNFYPGHSSLLQMWTIRPLQIYNTPPTKIILPVTVEVGNDLAAYILRLCLLHIGDYSELKISNKNRKPESVPTSKPQIPKSPTSHLPPDTCMHLFL